MAPAPLAQGNAAFDELDNPRPEVMRSLFTKPMEYVVVHEQVVLRRKPCTKAAMGGLLRRGQRFTAYPQGRWVLQSEAGVAALGAKESWVLTDGARLGLGRLLAPVGGWCLPRVQRSFAEALIVEWDRLPLRTGAFAEYCLEWTCDDRPDEVHVAVERETMTLARVHGLPPDSNIRLRLTVVVLTGRREDGGEAFATVQGEWVEAETDWPVLEAEEGQCCDPLSNLRGRCMDCRCPGFVIANFSADKPHDSLEAVLCRRCSCSCIRHKILGEFRCGPQGMPSAPKAKPESESFAPPQRPGQAALLDEGMAEGGDSCGTAEARPARQDKIWRPDDITDGDRVVYVLDRIAEAETLYETLGVAPDAEDAAIRRTYRTVSLVVHPDKVSVRGDQSLMEQAEAAFKIVSSAYEILKDSGSRFSYDRDLQRRRPGTLRRGSRALLATTSFLKRFLVSQGGFGWDLNAKPPGDWQEQGRGVYSRSRTFNITVTHAISGDEFKVSLERGATIGLVKKHIVKKVRRGPESRIELCGTDGKELENKHRITQSEVFVLVGISLGPPQDVELCLCHSDSGGRLRICVPDTSTIAEVRQEAADALCTTASAIRLGCRARNVERFQRFDDSELLNGRTQLLLLGVELEPSLEIEEATDLQSELLGVYSAPWFQERLSVLLEESPLPHCLRSERFREEFGELVKYAQREILAKYAFDGPQGVFNMYRAFAGLGEDLEVSRLAGEIDKQLRVTSGGALLTAIDVKVEACPWQCTESAAPSIVVTVLKNATVRDVRAAVAEKLQVQLSAVVLLDSTSLARAADSERVGSKRKFGIRDPEIVAKLSEASNAERSR